MKFMQNYPLEEKKNYPLKRDIKMHSVIYIGVKIDIYRYYIYICISDIWSKEGI